jgi:(2Fe-2S) ferredoxin
MSWYDIHLFVCTNERAEDHPRPSCGRQGGAAIREAFARAFRAHGVSNARANKAGCMERCEEGPCVVVYPEGVWYRIENPEQDAEAIVREHLVDGRVVERLLLPPRSR